MDKSTRESLYSWPKEKTLLIASFFVTNPEALKRLKSQWALRDSQHSKIIGRTKRQTKAVLDSEIGGSITLMDPDNLKRGFLEELFIESAFGTCYVDKDKSLYVASGTTISKVKFGKSHVQIKNLLFNDLHSLSLGRNNSLLATSTGTDGVIEINTSDGIVQWDWLATENGYDKTPEGKKRIVNRKKNYNKIVTATPEHTTHVNSAICFGKRKILATFFHQGALIEIDRITKQSRKIICGLKSPHSIHQRQKGYMLCDTREGRILLLDPQLKIQKELRHNFNWLQDAVEMQDHSFIAGDSNNNRILKLNRKGKYQDSFCWGENERKFANFELISVDQAKQIF